MTLKLMGSSSGSTSIQAPASGSDRTITFPDAAGTVDTTARSGNILQIVENKITSFSSKLVTTAYSDITGMNVSITPQSSTSKIYLMAMVNFVNLNQHFGFKIVRRVGGSDADPTGWLGTANGSRTASLSGNVYNIHYNGGDSNAPISLNIIDADHATTSEITYQLQAHNSGSSYYAYFNGSHNDSDGSYTYRAVSTFIAMEIAV